MELTTMRLPTYAYGKEFTHIPEHVREDLETLEREGVIYTDHWIDEVDDFRHVSIEFTPEECDAFARRSWAYELFLRADDPTWAAEIPGIDDDIAKQADTYSLHLRNGVVVPPPYHCFAAFLGEHLEKMVCSVTDRRTVIELSGREGKLYDVKRTILCLTPTIRSFNSREKGLTPWDISCEDDVRDLLFVMLRPLVADMRKEEAVPSKAGTHKFVDFCSQGLGLLIELKWIGKPGSWKKRLNEVYVDIQSYVVHPACDSLFFVIVDAVKDIPDPRQLEEELTGVQVIDGREVNIRMIVCET